MRLSLLLFHFVNVEVKPLLHLSIIRYQYDIGFRSVVRRDEQVEQQIESLTLANNSQLHLNHLQSTITVQ